MKRIIPALLSISLLLNLPTPAMALGADGQGPDGPVPSVSCPESSMFPYREVFWDVEKAGLAAPLTADTAAVLLARLEELSNGQEIGGTIASPMAWAVENGIFPENAEGFSSAAALTRESFACAVCAWLAQGMRTLPVRNEAYPFEDKGQMSQEGQAAATYLQQRGVMVEDAGGNFSSAATVTVAEAEGILLRVMGAMTDRFAAMPVSSMEESAPVDKSWFDDACFIGHSQVVGMMKYFDLDNADYYCLVGYTAQNILDYPWYTQRSGKMGDLAESVASREYNKVYIMLGINDCDNTDDRIAEFKKPMREILQIVKEAQPQATIYLISLAPVGREIHYQAIYNLENIIMYSQALKDLSREFDTEYIDLFRYLADEEGYLLEQFDSGDSLHFKPGEYHLIEDFLKCHT